MDSPKLAQGAVTSARDHVFERAAVQDERAILKAAMDRSMGQATLCAQNSHPRAISTWIAWKRGLSALYPYSLGAFAL